MGKVTNDFKPRHANIDKLQNATIRLKWRARNSKVELLPKWLLGRVVNVRKTSKLERNHSLLPKD